MLSHDLAYFVPALHPSRNCCSTLGRSREPPVAARFGYTNDETKLARAARYPPKRLPSRPWAITRVNDVRIF